MEKKHKDTLVKATLINSNTRRLTIPNLGEYLYMRKISDTGVIMFVPQTIMDAASVGVSADKM